MIMKMICYKDLKLNVFTQPNFIDGNRTTEDIIEMTRRMCANPNMPKVYFEYDLYCVGTFDDKLGTFETAQPEFICSLGDFRHLASQEEVKENVVAS